MCGVAGLILKKPITDIRLKGFLESSNLMSHRGPDYKGVYRDEHVLLIHFRLAIIDLDARSHQPMFSKDQSSVLIYNGELYNYRNLKTEYKIDSVTSSDTEILLESFLKGKEEACRKWNGIFAAVIYDKKDKRVHLIRDRFGVKPLYIYENDEVVAFASEAKVILDWLPEFKLDYKALNQYVWYGNTTRNRTCVNGLRKVDRGAISTYDLKGKLSNSIIYFWRLQNVMPQKITEKEAIEETGRLLNEAVSRQLVSDVPLGVLLSGGVDSSSIVALASQLYDKKLDTYSVEYDYNIGGKSELDRASLIAKKYHTNQHELVVTTKDVKETFEKLVFQYDEPFADPASIPLYQLARECSKDKRVLLQGDGGDEFFAGYRRYNAMRDFWFWKYASKFYYLIPHRRWAERMKRINFIYGQSNFSKTLAYYMTEEVPYKSPYYIFSQEVSKMLSKNCFSSDYQKLLGSLEDVDPIQQMLFADTEILLPNRYLEKVDKATMLESIEARVPFLDNDLTEFALGLPAKLKVRRREKKFLLKMAMKSHVPKEILYGPKRGFGVPFREWLRKDLYDFAKEQFLITDNNIFDSDALINLLEMHRNRKVDYSSLLWKALVLICWMRIYKNKISLR